VEKDQSPLDEGKMKPISEDDSVMGGGDTIRIDWRLPLLECLRNPRKTMASFEVYIIRWRCSSKNY
jgi:hypothetical protein